MEFQHSEETITENLLFELLQSRLSNEIKLCRFSKHIEGKNGADWEWWVTNSARNKWLGMRVQAKIMNYRTRMYEHLHYQSGNPKTYQATKLKRDSLKAGLIPIYCLYSYYSKNAALVKSNRCFSFPFLPEIFGCSLISLKNVEKLQRNNKTCDYDAVMRHVMPWHCIVCCHGFDGDSLPSRTMNWLHMLEFYEEDASSIDVGGSEPLGIRRTPPLHISRLSNGFSENLEPEYETDSIGAVVVIESERG